MFRLTFLRAERLGVSKMKKATLFGILAIGLFLNGCSRPATNEQILNALQKCPSIRSDIEFHRSHSVVGMRGNPKVIKKSDLRSWLSDCEKEKKLKNDPNSEQNIIERQRSLIGDYN